MVAAPKPGPTRILLVEDEALIALDIQDTLEAAGHVIAGIADRVGTALATASTGTFDVAVLDVDLDGEQIWPVTRILQERSIPFILLTGMLATADVAASCAGAPRLSKPVDYPTLLEAVATLGAKRSSPPDQG